METRLAMTDVAFSDMPLLLMSLLLVLVLSGIVATVSQQRQGVRKHSDDPKQRHRTRKLSNIGLSTLVTEVPTNLSIPVSLLTVDGILTKKDYVERLRVCVMHDAFFWRWRSVVRGDYHTGVYKFVEVVDYDIEWNVVDHTIEEGETIMSYIESVLVNRPLDFDKPLWEMHVIHDPKNNPGITSVGWKVHHCIGDGASLATAMAKLSDQSELFDAMLAKRAQTKTSPKTKKSTQPLSQTFKDIVVFLYICIWSLYVIAFHMIRLMVRREPATVFKRPGGKHKRLSYNMLYSVRTTKEVGKRFHATVNDVMLNVVAGAMRKTMLAVGESVSPTLNVRCAIPVDMRSSTEVIHHTNNRFSSLVIELPVGIEDPAERLRKITAAMNEAKNSLEKYFMYWSTHLVSMLPAPIMRVIVHFATDRISAAVSNVRASVVEMSLCKSRVSGFYGFVPPPPYVNLGVAILSMGDDLGLNVLIDPCVGINAKQFLDFAKEEFIALTKSAASNEANFDDEKKAK